MKTYKIRHAELKRDYDNGKFTENNLTAAGKICDDPETFAIDEETGEFCYLYQSEIDYKHDIEYIRIDS